MINIWKENRKPDKGDRKHRGGANYLRTVTVLPGMLVVPCLELVLERCVALLEFKIDLLYRVCDRGR